MIQFIELNILPHLLFMKKLKKQWRYWLFFWLILGMTACQSVPSPTNLPQPKQASKLFKIEQRNNNDIVQQSMLVLQYQPTYWRWVQTDPLGAPLARVLLTANGWQNDGFIMPNTQARWLFAAIATALYPNAPIFAFSQIKQQGDTQHYFIDHKYAWTLNTKQNHWDITLADNSHWHVTLLN